MAKEYVRYQEILDMVKEETGFDWFEDEVEGMEKK